MTTIRKEDCKDHWTNPKCECVKKAQEEDLKKRIEEKEDA